MTYPIVQVETKDHLWLHGLLLEAKNSKAIFIQIHGTASNFYEEDFVKTMAERFVLEDVSILSTNNRGVGVYDAWDGKGTATELFKGCLLDIDAWVKFALERGYKKIFLSGHSLGTEKVVYYMAQGTYRAEVTAIVLLAPADSPGWRLYDEKYRPSAEGRNRVASQVERAQQMVDDGRGDELMNRKEYGGIMPKTPKSLLNFLGPNTEIRKTLPFHSGKLDMYSKINVPILAIIGDQEEYTSIPPQQALELMKKENSRTEIHQLKNCDHDFNDREDELIQLVAYFVKNITSKSPIGSV